MKNRNLSVYLAAAGLFLAIGFADGLLRYFAEQNRPDALPFFSALMTKMPGWVFAAMTLPVVILAARAYERSKRRVLAHAGVAALLSACVLFVVASATFVTQFIRSREISWRRTPGIIFEELDELFFVALSAYVAFFLGALLLRHFQKQNDKIKSSTIDSEFPGRLALNTGKKTVLVESAEVLWVESAGNYVSVHTATTNHLVRDSMKNFEQMLDPARFFRAHRTVIVNLDSVREVRRTGTDGGEIVLLDGTKLPMSRARREDMEQRLAESGFGA